MPKEVLLPYDFLCFPVTEDCIEAMRGMSFRSPGVMASFYAGWLKAWAAFRMAKEVWATEEG